MHTKKINVAANVLEYVVFNNHAAKTIICFHGFGQSGTAFGKLAKAYPNYKVIAVNLFFHGGSILRPIKPLELDEWRQYLKKLVEAESLETFSVAGYSMGGRFALATLVHFPVKVEALYLLAPDGLVESTWYYLATRNTYQRKLFKKSLSSYTLFSKAATTLSKVGFIHKGLLKFAQIQIKTVENRQRVYNAWTCFRKLKLSPTEFDSIITRYRIPATIVLGAYDRVVSPQRITPKLKKGPFLTILQVPITHSKLFYYNFLDRKANSASNSNELV